MCRNKHFVKWNCIQCISNLVIVLALCSIVLFIVLLFVQAYVTGWTNVFSVLMQPRALRYLLVGGFSLLTLWLTIITLHRSVKTEEMNAIVSLRNLFNQKENKEVYEQILKGNDFKLDEKRKNEGDVNNYIGTLEVAYLMVERGVINMEEFENLFGYRLNNLFENEDLYKYIREDRKYNAILFRAIHALHKYQRERKQKY